MPMKAGRDRARRSDFEQKRHPFLRFSTKQVSVPGTKLCFVEKWAQSSRNGVSSDLPRSREQRPVASRPHSVLMSRFKIEEDSDDLSPERRRVIQKLAKRRKSLTRDGKRGHTSGGTSGSYSSNLGESYQIIPDESPKRASKAPVAFADEYASAFRDRSSTPTSKPDIGGIKRTLAENVETTTVRRPSRCPRFAPLPPLLVPVLTSTEAPGIADVDPVMQVEEPAPKRQKLGNTALEKLKEEAAELNRLLQNKSVAWDDAHHLKKVSAASARINDLVNSLQVLADLAKCTVDEMARQLRDDVRSLFPLPASLISSSEN